MSLLYNRKTQGCKPSGAGDDVDAKMTGITRRNGTPSPINEKSVNGKQQNADWHFNMSSDEMKSLKKMIKNGRAKTL